MGYDAVRSLYVRTDIQTGTRILTGDEAAL